jgi:O-antigen ligase
MSRGGMPGWRTARGGVTLPPAAPQPIFLPKPDVAGPDGTWTIREVWARTRWSLLLVGLLGYIFVATTQRIAVGDIMIGAALLGLALEGRLRLPRLLVWFGAFVFWGVISAVAGGHIGVATDPLIELAKVWVITLLVVNALTTRPRQQVFILFSAFCFALYPARGTLLNYVAGETVFGRAIWNGIYKNPNDLATLTLLQFSMVASLLVGGARGWARRAALAGVLVLPLIVLLTQSRGALIALAVTLVVGFWRQRRHIKPRHALALLCLGGLLAALAPKGVWERLGGLRHATDEQGIEAMDAEGSARGRWEIWKIAVRIIGSSPISGVGYGAYGVAHSELAFKLDVEGGAQGQRDTHSTLLKVTAETGIVGLALFIGIVGSVVVFAERVRRRARRTLPTAARQLLFLELGILAFHIAGIWGSYANISFTYLHLALVWTFAESCRQQLVADGGLARMRERGSVVPRPGS